MKRTAVITLTLATPLLLAGCVTAGLTGPKNSSPAVTSNRFPPVCQTVADSQDSSISRPQIVHKVTPDAHDESGRLHRGWACAEITVSADGGVKDVRIVARSDYAVAQAFQRALPRWRYKPATRDGVPIEFRMNVAVDVW
jgi:TonB family protein